jgi:hypothetical protein
MNNETERLEREAAGYARAACDPREWPHHREYSASKARELWAKLARAKTEGE